MVEGCSLCSSFAPVKTKDKGKRLEGEGRGKQNQEKGRENEKTKQEPMYWGPAVELIVSSAASACQLFTALESFPTHDNTHTHTHTGEHERRERGGERDEAVVPSAASDGESGEERMISRTRENKRKEGSYQNETAKFTPSAARIVFGRRKLFNRMVERREFSSPSFVQMPTKHFAFFLYSSGERGGGAGKLSRVHQKTTTQTEGILV